MPVSKLNAGFVRLPVVSMWYGTTKVTAAGVLSGEPLARISSGTYPHTARSGAVSEWVAKDWTLIPLGSSPSATSKPKPVLTAENARLPVLASRE